MEQRVGGDDGIDAKSSQEYREVGDQERLAIENETVSCLSVKFFSSFFLLFLYPSRWNLVNLHGALNLLNCCSCQPFF